MSGDGSGGSIPMRVAIHLPACGLLRVRTGFKHQSCIATVVGCLGELGCVTLLPSVCAGGRPRKEVPTEGHFKHEA